VTPLLRVEDLSVGFPVFGGLLRRRIGRLTAVDRVSFTIGEGEVLGLVGESGSGKSTVGRAILNLLRFTEPAMELSGRVVYRGGVDLLGLSRRAMRPWRSRVQMVFQDPQGSLNPRLLVHQLLDRPLRLHTPLGRAERRARVRDLLERVGLSADHGDRYPHELSGGQRQRVGLARALATSPELIVADEPVSALDVSVQAQVVNLILELKRDLGLTWLFVAHDLSVVHHVSDRIAVMYLGRIVEIGPADVVREAPRHPYTQALIAAIPRAVPRASPRAIPPERHEPVERQSGPIRLTGEVPSPFDRPSGCAFRTRCPVARPACADDVPALVPLTPDHAVACPFR
jgi:oligopeptide transport system ATP-binding protein